MGRKSKARASAKDRRHFEMMNMRGEIHPEVRDALDAQLRLDQDWFNQNPEALCHFRPGTAFEIATGLGFAFLSHPDEAPEEAQTWIALVDVPRLVVGRVFSKSFRSKFRCLPVDFDDSEQVELATDRAIRCTFWTLNQWQQGNSVLRHYFGPNTEVG